MNKECNIISLLVSCFDLLNNIYVGEYAGVDPASKFWRGVNRHEIQISSEITKS